MEKKVLIFLPFADQKNFREDEHPDFMRTQLSISAILQEMGEVFNFQDIPGKNAKEFIQKKIEELCPDWIIAEGNSATVLLELKLPNSILINLKVNADIIKEVPKEVKDSSFGYFGNDFEKDYEIFQSVYPNSAWYPAAKISILSLKSMVETIINSDEEW